VDEAQWTAVDRYVADRLIPPDAALDAALEASAAAGLPEIQVTPTQGKLLWLLATIQGARNILEIGTLGGYSTIWLAQALPLDGRLVTVESAAIHAEVARANIARAGLAEVVDLRLGRALDVLPQLEAEHKGPFDLTFIDADKASTPDYFEWAVRLSRRGSLIIADNVVREGAILDADSTDSGVQGVRLFYDLFAGNSRVSATAIQTVGSKGHDGFAIALVMEDV
jgi:predicted O-methyltransferase YrrM